MYVLDNVRFQKNVQNTANPWYYWVCSTSRELYEKIHLLQNPTGKGKF